MSGLDSYFNQLEDQYLYDNVYLARDSAGEGYYVEQVVENIQKPKSHPNFNRGPAHKPPLEEQLAKEYLDRMPRTQEERTHAQQRSQQRLNYNVYSQGKAPRRYDSSNENLGESMGAQVRRQQPYGSNFVKRM